MLRAPVLLLLLTTATLLACGSEEPAPPPRPLPSDSPPEAAAEVPSPGEQAERIAQNPQLLLFDLETALESAQASRGTYPTTTEFEADDRWSLHRAALSAAFTEWSYESDGATYRLEGTRGGRMLSIESDGGTRP